MNESKNPLLEYMEDTGGKNISKWSHYFDIYHRHLSKFRNKEVTIVEIGVYRGGSLKMWENYFGEDASIIGIDIDNSCNLYASDNIEIIIGDQEDRDFLKQVCSKIGPVDVIIDDGGHTMAQQKNSFEELYALVKSGGVYLVEDVHTSYWKSYGGGFRVSESFIEYSKNLIDQLNAFHTEEKEQFSVNQFTKTTTSMHFYDSVVVFEKGEVSAPVNLENGKPVN